MTFAGTGREAWIVEALRTPMGKGHPEKGWYRDVHPNRMLGDVYRALLAATGLAPDVVEDLVIGCTAPFGEQSRNIARNAWLQAGYPPEVPATVLDRRCGSAQTAVEMAAALVASGTHDLVIAGGVEHMGHIPMNAVVEIEGLYGAAWPEELRALYDFPTMGESAERIAERWGIGRAEMDEFAARSHALAAAAVEAGRFEREMIPLELDGELRTSDQGIRPGTTAESLAGLKPVFRPDGGQVTAGSSSPLTDGAAGVVVASDAAVEQHGLTKRARILDQTTVGVDPELMLTGPIPATRKLLERTGLVMSDIDLVEVNEAFSSVVLAWERELKPDMDRVNVNGGAIALGHPVGASGSRLFATLLAEMERRDVELGLVTMCCGGGLGTATLVQRVWAESVIDVGDFLRPGDGVWWGQGSAEPELLVNQVLDAVDRVGPIRAFSGLTWNERLATDLPDGLTVVSYGGLGRLRGLSRHGRLDVVPCHYSAIPRLFATGQLPNDLGLVQVSPPDSDGMVTLGIGVEYVADAIRHTRTLVAEVNAQMPATTGGPRLPLSAFAALVPSDRPLRETPGRAPDAVDRRIADHVASIVHDGATIQIGVGSVPSAVLESLSGHQDLGFHSGMISDGVLTLIEKGVMTGARKEIDPGLAITGAALCTAPGYLRVAEPPVEFRPASYTHSPLVLSQLGSLVSINSAIEVDLLGQVGAEVARGVHIGAVGGQVDFSRAASLTGTRSIIALRSTNGSDSTIVPALHGGVVTTARVDVDAVVTEHGVAMLTGCTVAERALRLVEVAAPEHREALQRSLAEQEL